MHIFYTVIPHIYSTIRGYKASDKYMIPNFILLRKTHLIDFIMKMESMNI